MLARVRVCVCAYCNEHNRNSESGFGHIGIHFINLISDKVQTDKRLESPPLLLEGCKTIFIKHDLSVYVA